MLYYKAILLRVLFLLFIVVQIASSVWVDVANKSVDDVIDFDELENIFSADVLEGKRPNVIGMVVAVIVNYTYK